MMNHKSSLAPFHILTVLLWLCLAMAASPPATAADQCERRCGGVEIPYPFGLDSACALPGFNHTCNATNKKPYYDPLEVLNISLLEGQARIMMYISSYCYDTTTRKMDDSNWWGLDLTDTPYRFSDTGNKFTAVGCRTLAYIDDFSEGKLTTTGCVATCGQGDRESLTDGACSGIGCCQTSIPKGLQVYFVSFDSRFNTTEIYNNMNRCSYAALVEASSFNFSKSYATSSTEAPVLVDWAIGNETCEVARHKPNYTWVSKNSECINSLNGPGYICNCSSGFLGNPYLQPEDPGSCQDIDECNEPNKYPCYGKCRNKDGGYICTCPFGTRGNAYIRPCDGGLAIGICVSLLVALLSLLGIEWIRYKQRTKLKDLIKLRDEYFHLHGGQLLTDMMNMENNISFKLYDRDEIELATKGFNKNSIIGERGQGKVHIGYNLDQNNNPVAIKKCKGFDENSRTEFTQELLVLSRVNHENIVKLLGCCLRFKVPVLVYEYVPHKTLHYLIHVQNNPSIRTLEIRLKVAAESAEALAYLHLLDHPVFHGDVKSSNILLNSNFIAKISDFGCSKIRATNASDNVVKGTIGYLDPEYLMKFQLTDKSDVYSFGVVLLELLTRRTPLSKENASLALVFQEAMREGTFVELIDREILHEDNMELICDLARLASQCLVMASESRPAMSIVAEELRRLARLVQHRGLLAGGSSFNTPPTTLVLDIPDHFTCGETTGYYSFQRGASMSIEFAR